MIEENTQIMPIAPIEVDWAAYDEWYQAAFPNSKPQPHSRRMVMVGDPMGVGIRVRPQDGEFWYLMPQYFVQSKAVR